MHDSQSKNLEHKKKCEIKIYAFDDLKTVAQMLENRMYSYSHLIIIVNVKNDEKIK